MRAGGAQTSTGCERACEAGTVSWHRVVPVRALRGRRPRGGVSTS